MYNVNINIEKLGPFRHEVRSIVWRNSEFNPDASFRRVWFSKKRAFRYATLMGLALEYAYNKEEYDDENQ